MLTTPPCLCYDCLAIMRVQFNGRIPAFQAGYVGSIPITRSTRLSLDACSRLDSVFYFAPSPAALILPSITLRIYMDQPPYSGIEKYLFYCLFPRRSKLCIACSGFFQKSELTHAVAPPFRKKSRLLRLFACKRAHNASAALLTFCGFNSTLKFYSDISFAAS